METSQVFYLKTSDFLFPDQIKEKKNKTKVLIQVTLSYKH